MQDPVVKVEQGQLRGKVDKNYNGDSYYSFHNIPYAKPPIRELRFRAPQPPVPWEGIRDATKEGDECYSIHMLKGIPVGSEDCLNLNVFTRDLPTDQKCLKPVMVWIHGGGFVTGSNKVDVYSPDFLICEDIVLVTINYRLGALGFLSVHDPSLGVPGNAGFKDAVMALKWVQKNIQEFNGDHNKVTIFGESAGSAIVHCLILSPMAKGLFHQAIIQSGVALNLQLRGKKYAVELAANMGCKETNEKGALEFLQNARKEDILKGQNMLKEVRSVRDISNHGVVIEKRTSLEEAFLPDDPINIILSGNYNKVPMIIGYNNREGMLFSLVEKKFSLENFEMAIPLNLHFPLGSTESKEVAARIKKFYYGDEEPSEINIDNFYKLQTDNFFLRETYNTIKHHFATSNQPIYFYRFSMETSLNTFKNMAQVSQKGVCHADDIGYLFNMQVNPKVNPGSIEERCVRTFVKLWTNFAKNGDPNEKEFNVNWLPIASDSYHCIDIDEKLTVGINPDEERIKFWNEIFLKYKGTEIL